jgi:phospholipid/cholesterol/gamma-HCH transport system substrate-binding protein
VRRLAALLVVVAAGAAALLGAGGQGETYRVDAIFDNAGFLIAGQDVKIAGAKVGSVKDVELTPQRKARVEMEIEPGFAPFRSDADCIVRPQSLIGEKFVQCHPGTPRGRPLAGAGGHAPTVPLSQTHSPVDLDLVFAALRRPYRERLRILVDELGTGLAGRSADLSAAIHRANPALQETNDVLAILNRDRRTLARLIDRSDVVLGELGRRDREVASFVGRADTVARAVASRRGDLGEAVRLLPPLLDQLEPASDRLAALATDAAPVVRDVRSAAPTIRALFADFDPLADAARPALRKLSEMSVVGRRAVRASQPVAKRLKPVAHRLPPIIRTATELVESLRETGTVEGLLRFPYLAALSTSRFDRFSHILPSYQLAGSCQQYATAPVEGCSSRWSGASAAASRRSRRRRAAGRHRARGHTRRRAAPTPRSTPAPRATPRPRRRSPLPLPDLPIEPPRDTPVSPLLDFLLGP